MRPILVGASLWVGDWRCTGERRPWLREVSRHVAIELQREGAHLREIGGDRRVVDPTTVAVQPADEEYRMASPTEHPQRSTVLLIRGELLDELGPVEAPSVGPLAADAALLHRRVVGARDPMAREEAALALAHRVVGGVAPRDTTPRASWRRVADEVQHAIATGHRGRLTLEMLARAARTSVFHMCRAFRAVTGESVHRHLRRVRLRVALYELDRDGGELSRVALAAGFSSHSHFTSAFRAEFAATPSSIRR